MQPLCGSFTARFVWFETSESINPQSVCVVNDHCGIVLQPLCMTTVYFQHGTKGDGEGRRMRNLVSTHAAPEHGRQKQIKCRIEEEDKTWGGGEK